MSTEKNVTCWARFARCVLPVVGGAILATCSARGVAQPGHGGPPPGQEKKHEHGGMPPGQAKKYDDWRFRQEDRDHFYGHYRHDVDHWRGKKRPVFVRGEAMPRSYTIQPVPRSYWQSVPPPPPGYQYGYSNGYVVAYDPTTRVVADVLDLVGAATGH
jgi:hypothetical protein